MCLDGDPRQYCTGVVLHDAFDRASLLLGGDGPGEQHGHYQCGGCSCGHSSPYHSKNNGNWAGLGTVQPATPAVHLACPAGCAKIAEISHFAPAMKLFVTEIWRFESNGTN